MKNKQEQQKTKPVGEENQASEASAFSKELAALRQDFLQMKQLMLAIKNP